MTREQRIPAWKVAAARSRSYRRWSMVVAVVTFFLAIASIASPGTQILVQLMYAAFAGAIVGRIVAALHSARSEALREDSKGEK